MTYPKELSFRPESRIVLVGTTICSLDKTNLPSLPHVERNIDYLAGLFANPDIVGLPPESIVRILDREEASALLTAIAVAAAEATDTLMVYYAGHGLYGDQNSPLYLVSKHTVSAIKFSAVKITDVKYAMHQSPARKRILILDCCYSGRAFAGGMGTMTDEMTSAIELEGTFGIAAVPGDHKALAPPEHRLTKFTQTLVNVLEYGIPGKARVLTLGAIFGEVKAREGRGASMPLPEAIDWKEGASFKFSKNPAARRRAPLSRSEWATREDLRLLRQVRSGAAEWERQERRDEFLWPDKRLMQAWAMIERLQPELDETEQRFVRPFDHDGVLDELNNPVTSHERRASIGDFLARGGDTRRGVSLSRDGLPDVVWCDVPDGEISLEGGAGTFRVERFEISKYLVTWAQYRTFLEAPDGYNDPEWWKLLGRDNDRPGEQYRPLDNHPAENVSWHDAVAFCRWLTARVGYHVRLPTEWEWQQAATGGNGAREFPWGDDRNFSNANTAESGLNRTTAVGMYVHGASPVGALDLSGNVWEWCLNEYLTPEQVEVTGDRPRVVRGGSFFYKIDSARAKYRDRDLPTWRNLGHGFRLVRSYFVSPAGSAMAAPFGLL
jgi:formylglycine-generating enzyme required for sulfatase activity